MTKNERLFTKPERCDSIHVSNLPDPQNDSLYGRIEKYRIPVLLYYSSDMSVPEIAKILHIPEGTVKSRMNKARQMLKKELEALGYDR